MRAVLWDFGGVILSSPFDAFRRYEADSGLPADTIRGINATNPDRNAWAQFERNELSVDGFCEAFEAEAALLGHRVDARKVLAMLEGEVRPIMVRALDRLHARGFLLALLTNNTQPLRQGRPDVHDIVGRFDVVVESSVVGIRKPEPRFYEIALERLAVRADEAAFLDDLGVNLKPAAAMGIRTIKVGDPREALSALSTIVGLDLLQGDE